MKLGFITIVFEKNALNKNVLEIIFYVASTDIYNKNFHDLKIRQAGVYIYIYIYIVIHRQTVSFY